ncbi:hypothetical protein EGY05_20960 [Chryseobacterium arthrosphaerae]|nr:hypothetical protein EGY05_20960 [Chryseobacterium arthrosphaerae]
MARKKILYTLSKASIPQKASVLKCNKFYAFHFIFQKFRIKLIYFLKILNVFTLILHDLTTRLKTFKH